jgi:hypothetical protein
MNFARYEKMVYLLKKYNSYAQNDTIANVFRLELTEIWTCKQQYNNGRLTELNAPASI